MFLDKSFLCFPGIKCFSCSTSIQHQCHLSTVWVNRCWCDAGGICCRQGFKNWFQVLDSISRWVCVCVCVCMCVCVRVCCTYLVVIYRKSAVQVLPCLHFYLYQILLLNCGCCHLSLLYLSIYQSIVSDALFFLETSPKGMASTFPYPHTPLFLVQAFPFHQHLFHI